MSLINAKTLVETIAAKVAIDWKMQSTATATPIPYITMSDGSRLEIKARVLPSLGTGSLGGTLPFSTSTVAKAKEGVPTTGLMSKFPSRTGAPITWPNNPAYTTKSVFWKYIGQVDMGGPGDPITKLECDTCYSTCYDQCWGGSLPLPERENYKTAVIDPINSCPAGSSMLEDSRTCVPLSYFPYVLCTIGCYGYYDCNPRNCQPSYQCNCRMVTYDGSWISDWKTRYDKYFWMNEQWFFYSATAVTGLY